MQTYWFFIILAQFLPVTSLQEEKGEGFREYRGFLVQNSEGKTYLTDSPHLNSCCVGKGKGIELLLVDFSLEPSSQHIASVRGNLVFKQGKYVLEQVEYVPETQNLLWVWLGAGLTLLAGSGFLILRR